MEDQFSTLSFEVKVNEGEEFTIPDSIIKKVSTGDWIITIQPKSSTSKRSHKAFLNGYCQEDENLYEEY